MTLRVKRPHFLANLQKHAYTSAPTSKSDLGVRPDHTTAAAVVAVAAVAAVVAVVVVAMAATAILLMRQSDSHASAIEDQKLINIHATTCKRVSEKCKVCTR
jgi:hypothetical protein